MRRFLTALVLTSLLVTAFPQLTRNALKEKSKKAAAVHQPPNAPSIQLQPTRLRDYLTFIASDEMEGRDTPSRGLDTTAKFLAMNLARWGFKPAVKRQFFPTNRFASRSADSGQTKVEIQRTR